MTNILTRTLVLAFLLTSSLAFAQGTYSQIDVPGAIGTFAQGINTAGDIVGNYMDATYDIHGFLLSGGVFTTIDYPGVLYTYLQGINDVDKLWGSKKVLVATKDFFMTCRAKPLLTSTTLAAAKPLFTGSIIAASWLAFM